MKGYKYGGAILLMLALAGCGGLVGRQAAVPPLATSTSTPPPTATAVSPLPEAAAEGSTMRSDNQGAIVVEITPVDLGTPGGTLVFDVSLDTHSVDLSMDLAAAATLTTDTGRSVNALSWEAPSGGHHVAGTLTFPASVDGAHVLSGAAKLTLTITGLDAPTRTFTWDLSP